MHQARGAGKRKSPKRFSLLTFVLIGDTGTRATAVAALRFAIFAPRAHIRRPLALRPVSAGPSRRIICALSTGSLRMDGDPAFVMWHRRSMSPDWSCLGVRPSQGPTSLGFPNLSTSPPVTATNPVATCSPT